MFTDTVPSPHLGVGTLHQCTTFIHIEKGYNAGYIKQNSIFNNSLNILTSSYNKRHKDFGDKVCKRKSLLDISTIMYQICCCCCFETSTLFSCSPQLFLSLPLEGTVTINSVQQQKWTLFYNTNLSTSGFGIDLEPLGHMTWQLLKKVINSPWLL